MNQEEMHFYRDTEGYPRVQAPSSYKVMAIYLEHDLQGSQRIIENVISNVDDILIGKTHFSTIVGNAFQLILSPELARIESLEDDDTALSFEIDLFSFRTILMRWLTLIKMPDSSND